MASSKAHHATGFAAGIIAAAETYLLVTGMFDGDVDAYEEWLAVTWTRLLAGEASG